jgi:hypothetical protein
MVAGRDFPGDGHERGRSGRRVGPTCQRRSESGAWLTSDVAEPPELFQLKCLSPALEARPHLNRNNTSVPRIWSDEATNRIKYHVLTRW